jgi:hypothetical protein
MAGEEREPSTTPAAAGLAASREQGPAPPPPAPALAAEAGEGLAYTIGAGVTRAIEGRPYERQPGDPLYRPLRIFALDPALPKLEGWVAVVNVPYEPIEPGFRGRVVEVDAHDGGNGADYRHLDLDDRAVLLGDGRRPSPTDPLFHQQMVYAVASLVYAAFKAALGRYLAWGFAPPAGAGGRTRLRLRPYAMLEDNAYYDEERGELAFGYFRASESPRGRNLPRGLVFTSLSHDIVAHEMTHALLDGLRAHFTVPGGPDVLAFHEGFADLVAIFQHFSYREVVETAIGRARGELRDASILASLAQQFGQTTGEDAPSLRTAIDTDPTRPRVYDASLEEHQLGSVLVSAVFDAFTTVFRRKTARYLRLATRGTGVLPPGELPPELRDLLAEKASRLAAQFLTMCIRAIDYCPPIDIELGEYLRAVITADHDLVPDDPWAYREAWVDAFRARGIHPRGVDFLSEDALLWRPPVKAVRRVDALTFAELRFAGDPACPASAGELRRQAGVLGRLVSRPEYLEVFGLAPAGHPRLGKDALEPPCVESIRSSRRVGPDGQIVFDLIAEVTQTRKVHGRGGDRGFDFLGGATVVIGPDGDVRYVVSKSVLNEERLGRQRAFMSSDRGRRLWASRDGQVRPAGGAFRALHRNARAAVDDAGGRPAGGGPAGRRRARP